MAVGSISGFLARFLFHEFHKPYKWLRRGDPYGCFCGVARGYGIGVLWLSISLHGSLWAFTSGSQQL